MSRSRTIMNFLTPGSPQLLGDGASSESQKERRNRLARERRVRIKANQPPRSPEEEAAKKEASRVKRNAKARARYALKKAATQPTAEQVAARKLEVRQRRNQQARVRRGAARDRRLSSLVAPSIETPSRYFNTYRSRTFTTGNLASYSEGIRRAATTFWNSLPETWRREGVSITMYYDFFEDRKYGLPQRLDSDGAVLEQYNGHSMTRLEIDGDEGDDNTTDRVTSLASMLELVRLHLLNRVSLKELYESGDLDRTVRGVVGAPVYFTPNHVTFSAHRRRLDKSVKYGDRSTYLFREVLSPNDTGDKKCVWNLLKNELESSRYPIRLSVDEMIEKTGLGSKVTLDQLEIIESQCLVAEGKKKTLKNPIQRGVCIFDARLCLRRLPPYQTPRMQEKMYVNAVIHNKHFYGFRSNQIANSARQNSLSYFEAYIRASAWPSVPENLGEQSWNLFRETQHMQPDYAAIREYLEAKYSLGTDAVKLVRISSTKAAYKAWHEVGGQNGDLTAWMLDEGWALYIEEKPGRAQYPGTWRRAVEGVCKHDAFVASHSDFVKIKGIGEVICEIVDKAPFESFKPSSNAPPPAFIKGLAEVEGTFVAPEVAHDMTWTVAMDIETCSLENSKGQFMTYAVGYRYMGERKRHVAQTEEDLDGRLMWRALQEWQALAEKMNAQQPDDDENSKKKRKSMYIYAHNGSRFDHIDAIHTILANSDEVPTDQLESNGKFISFRWKDLLFRDSCLLVMSSLANACTSFSIPTAKGNLPHLYLQGCRSKAQIIERLHATLTWNDLEPYMQWFSETPEAEMHQRPATRRMHSKAFHAALKSIDPETTDRGGNMVDYWGWVERQPLRKFWTAKREVEISFCKTMSDYLDKDVDALWELCEKVGDKFASELGSDIRVKCTLGSTAEHVWKHTLKKDIPKLLTQEQHDLWQTVNRGGFCGALGQFDYTAAFLEWLWKVDITSLYPAASKRITFTTRKGLQEPLKEWYRAFPDPTAGWFERDFGGEEMTDLHYDLLSDMHGLVRVTFDQSHLKFPFFLKKMQHKTFGTLAPVLKATENYVIPHIRMAYKYGVKIRLHYCQFCKESREVYDNYIERFSEVKNGADAVLKGLFKKNTGVEQHMWNEEDTSAFTKATVDRTTAKLFLNALPGRNNMKLDRRQTLVTGDVNDTVCLRTDDKAFRSTTIEDIQCGDQHAYRATFKEGSYEYHIQNFDVCPYISAYMLGYSKMLMQASFQYIAKIGGKPLYTDTDSIAFAASKKQWKKYRNHFVPIKKEFGGMELEGKYKRLITVGPKKYACVKADGSYEWACNGLPAKANAKTDILSQYESVLAGEVVMTDYFSINATSGFRLHHTEQAQKALRFICLKGRVKDGGIRWWENEEQFREYASGVTPVGFEGETRKVQEALPPIPIHTSEAFEERELYGLQVKPVEITAFPETWKQVGGQSFEQALENPTYCAWALKLEEPNGVLKAFQLYLQGRTIDLRERFPVSWKGVGGRTFEDVAEAEPGYCGWAMKCARPNKVLTNFRAYLASLNGTWVPDEPENLATYTPLKPLPFTGLQLDEQVMQNLQVAVVRDTAAEDELQERISLISGRYKKPQRSVRQVPTMAEMRALRE